MSTATPPPYSPAAPASHRRTTHTPPPAARSRTALWVWTAIAAFVVLVGAVLVVLQVTAGGVYATAVDAYDRSVNDTAEGEASLTSVTTADADLAATASSIAQSAPDGLVDAGARDALAGAATSFATEVADAQSLAGDSLPTVSTDKPFAFWDQLAEADALRSDTADLDDRRTQLSSTSDDLDTAAAALDDSANTLYASAGAAGAAFEAGHIDARNGEVIAFRDAEDALAGASGVTSDALDAMTAYATAASAVVASEQEELASIQGPLYDARLAAQAFARSIDGGVLVEFDWAPTVNGFGEGGSVSGYTTWNYDHGGHAVILLSDSVAELWPSDVSKNLIAHEVGHAISSKCPTLYNDQDQASIEAFATAWAISMGYTGDGNGVSIYGQPSDALIASAATCR